MIDRLMNEKMRKNLNMQKNHKVIQKENVQRAKKMHVYRRET